MPDFGAISSLLGAIDDILSAFSGFVGSLGGDSSEALGDIWDS